MTSNIGWGEAKTAFQKSVVLFPSDHLIIKAKNICSKTKEMILAVAVLIGVIVLIHVFWRASVEEIKIKKTPQQIRSQQWAEYHAAHRRS